MPCRELEHARLRVRGADHERRPVRTWPARAQLAFPRFVIRPREIDVAVTQQSRDDRPRFGERVGTMVDGVTEGTILRLIPAGTQTENQASVADLFDGVSHLGLFFWIAE